MRIGITIDCPDPEDLAAFWERFLGYGGARAVARALRHHRQTTGAGAEGPPI